MTKLLNAKEAKEKFGQLLISVQQEPIVINKNGNAVAVVLSFTEYQKLKDLIEDSILVKSARKAKDEGFLSKKDSNKLLSKLINL